MVMKAKAFKMTSAGYVPCSVEDATHIEINVPGPIPTRIIPVIIKGSRRGTKCWTWNGSLDKPDLKPSLLTKTGYKLEVICHSFVNDGKVKFLSDCTHEFAGKTMDLLDVEGEDDE